MAEATLTTKPPDKKPLHLPCPFCGGDTQQVRFTAVSHFGLFQLRCLTCNARGPTAVSRAQAEEVWNDRVVLDVKPPPGQPVDVPDTPIKPKAKP